tara:strand:- start:1246 stop:1425 length:180 start_codon:yes stop_codon:yes gene_type:complete
MAMFMNFDASGVHEVSFYKELSREFCAEILNYNFGKQSINENKRIKISALITWIRGGMV